MQIHQTGCSFVTFLRINEFSWKQYTIIDVLRERLLRLFESGLSWLYEKKVVQYLPQSIHPIAIYVVYAEYCYRTSIQLNRLENKHV